MFDLIAGDKTKVMTITQPPAAPVVANLIASDGAQSALEQQVCELAPGGVLRLSVNW